MRRVTHGSRIAAILALSWAILSVAMVPPAASAQKASPASSADDPFAQCLAGAGTMLEEARCYGDEQQRLEAEQRALLSRLTARLSRPGPARTDYPAARAALDRAQAAWVAYQQADCAIVDDVFGEGNAKGLAGATCTIDHYSARNAVLRDLLESYLARE